VIILSVLPQTEAFGRPDGRPLAGSLDVNFANRAFFQLSGFPQRLEYAAFVFDSDRIHDLFLRSQWELDEFERPASSESVQLLFFVGKRQGRAT
jgi:hypothetical protein